MAHVIKRGDLRTLRWNLERDLTGVSAARVVIADRRGAVAVDRAGAIDAPATAGIVSLALQSGDWAAGKLAADTSYRVEIETSPGPVTHPDSGYEALVVVGDLA